MIAIFLILTISCLPGKHITSMQDVKLKIVSVECIDYYNTSIQIVVYNGSRKKVKLDKDSFILKRLYDINGNIIFPKVLYDPVKERTREVITVSIGTNKSIGITFYDLQYYDIKQEEFFIEFEYSNLINKSRGLYIGIIQIEPIKTKVCT